jgi:hypothetical protein
MAEGTEIPGRKEKGMKKKLKHISKKVTPEPVKKSWVRKYGIPIVVGTVGLALGYAYWSKKFPSTDLGSPNNGT